MLSMVLFLSILFFEMLLNNYSNLFFNLGKKHLESFIFIYPVSVSGKLPLDLETLF